MSRQFALLSSSTSALKLDYLIFNFIKIVNNIWKKNTIGPQYNFLIDPIQILIKFYFNKIIKTLSRSHPLTHSLSQFFFLSLFSLFHKILFLLNYFCFVKKLFWRIWLQSFVFVYYADVANFQNTSEIPTISERD